MFVLRTVCSDLCKIKITSDSPLVKLNLIFIISVKGQQSLKFKKLPKKKKKNYINYSKIKPRWVLITGVVKFRRDLQTR